MSDFIPPPWLWSATPKQQGKRLLHYSRRDGNNKMLLNVPETDDKEPSVTELADIFKVLF